MLLEYSGIKSQRIGRIPSNWKLIELKELISIGPTNGVSKSGEYIGKGDYLLLDINGLYSGLRANFGQTRSISLTKVEKERYLLKNGDILFNRVSVKPEGVGKAVLVENVPQSTVFESNMIRIRVNENYIKPEYLVEFLSSPISRKQILSQSKITAQASISQETITSLLLPLPPLSEQHKIAEILSTWDDAIAKTEQLITALRERKKGLMQRLLTGQVRFPGFSGEWCEFTLKEIAKNIVDGPFGSNLKTSDYVDNGIPVLQGNNITNDDFVWNDIRYISEEKAEELKRSKVYVDDHLMIKIGSIGYSAILKDLHGHKCAIIPANLAKISINQKIVDNNYFHYWLTSDEIKRYFNKVSSRTAQPALSLKTIRQTKILLPDLEEQKKISILLQTCDYEIKSYEKILENYKQIKKGLMQFLLTGQVRVKV